MPAIGHNSVVLVTGYPSFEARLLVNRILEQERTTRVYCVVPSQGVSDTHLLVNEMSPDIRDRVVLFQGDPAGMDMGLSGREYQEVASHVDRIYSFSQVVRPDSDRERAHYINVAGAIEAVSMAKDASHLKCLVLRSTAAVSGSRTGVVLEDELMAGQQFRNVVEETLAHAERIARRAITRGVPIAVLRPSMTVGHSQTGEVEHWDGPYALIQLIINSPADIALPLPTRGDVALNLVPVDYVANAAHHIGCDSRSPGRTFHLVDPAPLSAYRVFDLVAQITGRRSPKGHIPGYIARLVSRAPGIERLLGSPRMLVEYLTTPVRYDARNTEEVLAGSGIACPSLESYVRQLVEFAREKTRQGRVDVEARRASQE